MSKTYNSFVSLRTVALIVILALTLWSLGLPTLGIAQAANVTNFSNTLSDSAPSAAADHTIEFTVPSDIPDEGTITLSLTSFGNVENITATDVELELGGTLQTLGTGAGQWELTTISEEVTLAGNSSTAIASSTEVVIRIGENTASGVNQITNPAGTGSYAIQVDVAGVDSGETQVAIVDNVTVTASVDTIFDFTVAGVNSGEAVNGTTTTGNSSSTAVAFGTLEPGAVYTQAQDLFVETNAVNGFAVTVQVDQQLQSSTGAVIEGFIEGGYTSTPTAWASPNPVIGETNTYGHWGLTTNDATVAGTDIFDAAGSGNLFVSASTTPVTVLASDGPADATTQNIGTARVGYQIEISALQPAADDYTATLTYVATPVF